MILRFNKYKFNCISILLISVIVFTYYFIFYIKIDIPINVKDFYMVLAYPSDPLYLKIIESLNNFSDKPEGKIIILYFIEIFIYKILGFEYIWVSAPIIKSISLSIIFLFLKKFYELNFRQQLILILFLFFLFFTNGQTFDDRFSRPHLVQILIPLSYLFFLIFNKKFKNFHLIISIVILTLVCFADPWLVSFYLLFYSFFLFIQKKYKYNLYVIIPLISIICLIFFIGNPITGTDNLSYEYLGYKEIYSNKNFILDYYISILHNYKFLILSFVFLIIVFLNKNFILLKSYILTIFFGWLPYTIINFSIQAYHTQIAMQSFLAYLIIFEVGKFIQKFDLDFSKLKLKYYVLIFLILILMFNNYESRIFSRSENIYKNYKTTFDLIDNTDDSCEVISNDIYVRAYVLAFSNNFLSVSDGFYSALKINDIIMDIKRSMDFIDLNYDFKSDKEYIESRNKFMHYATHNYFSISNSLIAPTLKPIIKNFDSINFDSTFKGWSMYYPNFSSQFNNYSETNFISSGIIILKNDYDYFFTKPTIINLCDKN